MLEKMSATVPKLPASVEEYSSKVIEEHQSKENPKNGLVNGLICTNHSNNSNKNSKESIDIKGDVKNVENDIDIHPESNVNSGSKSKKKSRKKKHKNKFQSIDDDVNETNDLKEHSSNLNVCQTESLIKENINSNNCNKEIVNSADGASSSTNCQLANEPLDVTYNLEKLIIQPQDINNFQNLVVVEEEYKKKIEVVQYESELQMQMIMKIIQKDLSEPYSIYTYRYFIHNWPKLCFLAMHDNQCVGAIVCKLDIHRKAIRRGYIAMLAVDQEYRKLHIGSTLVEMAIHEMIIGDADEVVLETEVTNKPALKLYEKLGFVRDKRLFRYYLNGVDALRLKLWLR